MQNSDFSLKNRLLTKMDLHVSWNLHIFMSVRFYQIHSWNTKNENGITRFMLATINHVKFCPDFANFWQKNRVSLKFANFSLFFSEFFQSFFGKNWLFREKKEKTKKDKKKTGFKKNIFFPYTFHRFSFIFVEILIFLNKKIAIIDPYHFF